MHAWKSQMGESVLCHGCDQSRKAMVSWSAKVEKVSAVIYSSSVAGWMTKAAKESASIWHVQTFSNNSDLRGHSLTLKDKVFILFHSVCLNKNIKVWMCIFDTPCINILLVGKRLYFRAFSLTGKIRVHANTTNRMQEAYMELTAIMLDIFQLRQVWDVAA